MPLLLEVHTQHHLLIPVDFLWLTTPGFCPPFGRTNREVPMRLRQVAIGFSLGVLSIATVAPPAEALVMCGRKTRSGEVAQGASMKLRDACRTSEVQIDPVALGLQGPPGDQGGPGPAGPAGPGAVVKDAAGNTVGVVIGGSSETGLDVAFELAGIAYHVEVDRFGTYLVGLGGYLRFETADCSGPAFVNVSGGPSLYPTHALKTTITAPGPASGVIYYTSDDAMTRTVVSYREGNSGMCFLDTNTTLTAEVLGPLVFTPPFHVEVP